MNRQRENPVYPVKKNRFISKNPHGSAPSRA